MSFDPCRVHQALELENAGQLDSRQGRHGGLGTRSHDQLVVGDAIAACEKDAPCGRVDGVNPAVEPDVYA